MLEFPLSDKYIHLLSYENELSSKDMVIPDPNFKKLDALYKISNCNIKEFIEISGIDLKTIKNLINHAKTRFSYPFNDLELDNCILKLAPLNFEHLIDLAALYRPGPITINIIDKYIKKDSILKNYLNLPEKVINVLKLTSGIPIYQEQMIKIIMLTTAYEKKSAWKIFKVILKLRHDKLPSTADDFFKNGFKQGNDTKTMQALWHLLLQYSMYTYKMRYALIFVRYACISSLLQKNGYI